MLVRINREYKETIGEVSVSAENLPIYCCVFCESFTSYASEFEDKDEPSDCGTCYNSKSALYNDYVGNIDTCELFKYWKEWLTDSA